jgi:hypothetical protein
MAQTSTSSTAITNVDAWPEICASEFENLRNQDFFMFVLRDDRIGEPG